MTWKELKQFYNGLPEDVLSGNVILFHESESSQNIVAEVMAEDYLFHDVLEGCVLESDAKSLVKDHPETYQINEFRKVYDKGTPAIWELF